MTETQTKTTNGNGATVAPPEPKAQLPALAPPRLAYHPAIEERFGIDRAGWKALVEAVFPAAKTPDSVILALSYCKARKLDPFKRVVHIVPVWDSEQGREIETVWPGIAEHRTTAFRTKQYAGADACQFGPTVTHTFEGQTKKGAVKATVTFPEWAQLTVYRLIDGQRVPVPGPRVYWTETYSKRGRADVPNDRWSRAPFQMIEKCAEAAALRRAFPEELGDERTAEEMEGQHIGPDNAKDVTPSQQPPRPTRSDPFPEPKQETQPARTEEEQDEADRLMYEAAQREQRGETVDAETGEVVDADEGQAEPEQAQRLWDFEAPSKKPVKLPDAATFAAEFLRVLDRMPVNSEEVGVLVGRNAEALERLAKENGRLAKAVNQTLRDKGWGNG